MPLLNSEDLRDQVIHVSMAPATRRTRHNEAPDDAFKERVLVPACIVEVTIPAHVIRALASKAQRSAGRRSVLGGIVAKARR
jgi:hypothetical protein